jgi:hypothetical protein
MRDSLDFSILDMEEIGRKPLGSCEMFDGEDEPSDEKFCGNLRTSRRRKSYQETTETI